MKNDEDSEYQLDFKLTFLDLFEQLYSETVTLSSISAMKKHPNYKKIVNFGLPAAIEILKMMQIGRCSILMVIMMVDITGEKVDDDIRGYFGSMILFWVNWGIEKGYIDEK